MGQYFLAVGVTWLLSRLKGLLQGSQIPKMDVGVVGER